MVSLANLADDLDLRFQFTVKPPFVPQWIEAPFFELQMLSIGTMVGRNSSRQSQTQRMTRIELFSRVHAVKKQLNVSSEFMAYTNTNCLPSSCHWRACTTQRMGECT
jgi:hypothetical protein